MHWRRLIEINLVSTILYPAALPRLIDAGGARMSLSARMPALASLAKQSMGPRKPVNTRRRRLQGTAATASGAILLRA